MSVTYKITKFQGVELDGACKLADNKMKNSSGAEITFPVSGSVVSSGAIARVRGITPNSAYFKDLQDGDRRVITTCKSG